MAIERFEGIVDLAKEQEIEIQALKEAMKMMEESQVRVAQRDTDIVKMQKGAPGRTWTPREYQNHDDVSGGFYAISSQDGKRPVVVINIKDPSTGKHSTRTRTRDNLVDAVIARNELAATLLKEGIIDFEYFLRITQN